jgi:ABC-type transporter Mla MlaB component
MAAKETPKSGLLSKVARFVANPTTDWAELDKPIPEEVVDPRQTDRMALKAMIELKRKNDFVRHREFTHLRKLRQKELGTLQSMDRSPDKPSFFQSSYPSRTDDKLVTLKKINDIEAQMSMQWWSTKHGNSTLPPPSTQHSQNFSSTFSPSDKSGFQSTSPGVVTVTGNSVLPIFEGRKSGIDSKPGFVNTQTARAVGVHPHKSSLEPIAPSTNDAPAPDQRTSSLESSPTPEVTQAEPMPETIAKVLTQALTPSATAPTALGSTQPPTSDETAAAAPAKDDSPSEFSSSRALALEVEEVAHDPELEEAAIRFANGDFAGAQAALQDALQSRESGLLNEEAWLALFDLYRATSDQTAFESLAIDYAGYFQRSSPQWINFPSLVEEVAPVQSEAPMAAHWRAPATLGIQSVATAKATLAKAASPWRVDWSRLLRIEEAALPHMIEMIRAWCQCAGDQFRFTGTDVLMALLIKETPPSHPQIAQNWWHLRMEMLRLIHRPDEFEIVALEYCITYEVSPPSWEPALCSCKICDASGASQQGGLTIIQAGSTELATSTYSHSTSSDNSRLTETPMLRETAIELSGHIHGDPQEAIDMLNAALEGADVMVISCEKLIRIDFSAAGALLNWVVMQQHEGRQVHFVQLHRMILAFFHVIGISDHARTSVRLH